MTSPCQLDSNQSSYYGLQKLGGWKGWWPSEAHWPMTFSVSFSLTPDGHVATSIGAFIPLIFSLSSPSTAAHPALRYPLYLSGEAHVHCLRGVFWGHAHTHHLAQRRSAHRARLRLWRRNWDQRVHELPADLQGDTEAQRKLHLHRQQRRCYSQLGEAADCYWWEWNKGGCEWTEVVQPLRNLKALTFLHLC